MQCVYKACQILRVQIPSKTFFFFEQKFPQKLDSGTIDLRFEQNIADKVKGI